MLPVSNNGCSTFQKLKGHKELFSLTYLSVIIMNFSNWMENLPERKRSQRITELVIPGSHNSGTFELSIKLPVGPDESELVQKLGNNPVLGKLIKSIIYRWGRCQHSSILDQLNIGIRYFDFRIGKINDGGDKDTFRILHALYGNKIEDILKDTNAFLNEHPEEVVILDFQKIYQCSKEDHEKIIELIESTFRGKLLSKNYNGDLSLSDLFQKKIQVIVIYETVWETSDHDQYLWPRSFCPNPWANTIEVSELFAFLELKLSKHLTKSLFVTQGIVTPRVKTVLLNPFSSLYKVTKKCNKKLPSWIEEKAMPLCPNIIMTDFVSDTQLPELIISLNSN